MTETKRKTRPRGPQSLQEARLAVMQEVAYVQKTVKGQLQYSFAGEAEVIRSLRPAMVKHGITVSPVSIDVLSETEYTTGRNQTRMGLLLAQIVYAFRFREETEEVVVLAEASDMGDKRGPKVMTIGLKYALRQFFLIETGDDPDEVVAHRNSANIEVFRRAISAIASASSNERLDKLAGEFMRETHGFDHDQMQDLNNAILKRRHSLRVR